MMRALKRFFISSSLAPQITHAQSKINTVLLPREETHHLKNVLRMKEGELCLLFDSEGHECVSRIERYRQDSQTELSVVESVSKSQTQISSLRLRIAQAIPQDRKMDEIVRQATELGVDELIPLMTERTMVRISEAKSAKVTQRWQRISDQTLKQSRLARAPRILEPITFNNLCQNLRSQDHIFILDTSSEAVPAKDLISEPIHDLLLIIGPEGGFSPSEIGKAKELGAKRVSLGSGILKTDTAFVAAASLFKLMWS